MGRRYLLADGVVAAILAPVGLLAAGAMWPGYNHIEQTVSELVMRGAPQRWLVSAFFVLYSALLIGFGRGVREMAREWERGEGTPGRYGLMSGNAVVALGLAQLALLLLPMDPIGGPRTPVGIAHLAVAGLLGLLAIAAALLAGLWLRGRPRLEGYRVFSLAAATAMALFGAVTFAALWLNAWGGLAERLIIGTYGVWMLVMGWKLLREDQDLRGGAGDTKGRG